MNARASIALMALLTACADQWEPHDFPVRVELAPSLSDEQVSATVDACARWNAAVGYDVLEPVEVDRESSRPGRVLVYAAPPPDAYTMAITYRRHDRAVVNLIGIAHPVASAHELGHALGLHHDDDGDGVMLTFPRPSGQILPAYVAHVRELMVEP